jgi:hypothetical protein
MKMALIVDDYEQDQYLLQIILKEVLSMTGKH